MKKTLLVLAAPALFFIASCGGSKTEENKTMEGMKEYTLKINGNDLSVMVPDSTIGLLEVTEQSWGAVELKVGANFNMSIEENDGDVALMKTDINGNEVFKLQRYIKDEPTLLFWEAKNVDMPDPRFHFYSILKVGNASYVVKDVERPEAYNEKAIQFMLDASKTLTSKAAQKANS
jgi:hypothetical protein